MRRNSCLHSDCALLLRKQINWLDTTISKRTATNKICALNFIYYERKPAAKSDVIVWDAEISHLCVYSWFMYFKSVHISNNDTSKSRKLWTISFYYQFFSLPVYGCVWTIWNGLSRIMWWPKEYVNGSWRRVNFSVWITRMSNAKTKEKDVYGTYAEKKKKYKGPIQFVGNKIGQ